MAFKKNGYKLLGFGVFLSRGPNVADPCGFYRYTISVNFGLWSWYKTWEYHSKDPELKEYAR